MANLWFAAAVFAASTILYGATFFGVDPERFPQLFLMHALALLVFFTHIASMGRNIRAPQDVDAWMKRNAPWLRRLGLALFLNAMVSLVVVFVVGRGGFPEKRGDKFVAVNRGKVVRELTAAEYRTTHGFAIRFFPSFWMVFSGYPLTIAIAKRKASSNDPFPVRQGFLWDRRS